MFACIHTPELPAGLSLPDFAYGFSPIVEEAGGRTVVIDAEGCELLFGSPYQLAKDIARRAKELRTNGGWETPVNVALAANPDAAIHAAMRLQGITFVSAGEELTCLGEFPLEALEISLVNVEKKLADEICETLRLWGIRTFRDFAALPVAGVSERLGQEGVRLQQLAAGKTERHLKVRQPAAVFANSVELDHPLHELEPLSFVFARLLNQLCATLNAYALATNELTVQMQLADQTSHDRTLSLPHPMRDHKVFLKLLLLDMEKHPPQAAVNRVAIACDPVKPRVVQHGLFVPLAPSPDKLELTLARLGKLVGDENIGSPVLLDTHRPDAFNLKRFELRNAKCELRNSKSAIRNSQLTIGFRMFRPPLRAVVQVDRGLPAQISAWGKQRSVYGRVVNVAGPWRTSGDWWRNEHWARDEWDVAVETGKPGSEQQAVYRIYRELNNGAWFVEGNYD